MTEAIAIDHLIDEIREIDRKLNHYRHNVHCHSCGRFAKQAVGYPEGVADCSTHGIGIRSDPWTGSIPIIVQPLDELAIEVPSPELTDFIVSITTVPDDLSSLLEEASARTP